jgi:hypothetical protein
MDTLCMNACKRGYRTRISILNFVVSGLQHSLSGARNDPWSPIFPTSFLTIALYKAKATFELLCDGVPMLLKGIDFPKGVVG